MGFFGNSIHDLLQKDTEDKIASNIIHNMMRVEFPEKFPKGNLTNFILATHEGVIEIVANLKIKKDEVYERTIEIEGKSKKYKIILKKDTIKEWNDKQKEKELQKEKENNREKEEDNKDFFRMLKWVGIIAGLIILFLIIQGLFF